MDYTKGPWIENSYGEIESVNGECIATPCEPGITFPNKANLSLILAAPDMYEALQYITGALKALQMLGADMQIFIDRAEQVLALAEGRNDQ